MPISVEHLDLSALAARAAARDRSAALALSDVEHLVAIGDGGDIDAIRDVRRIAGADAGVAVFVAGHLAASWLSGDRPSERSGWYGRATDTARLSLTADADGLRLDGTARLSSGAGLASYLVLDGLTLADGPGRLDRLGEDAVGATVTAIIGSTQPGVRLIAAEPTFGVRAAPPARLRLDGVRLGPARARLTPDRTRWLALDEALQVAIDLGILQAFLVKARAFLLDGARPWHESGVDRASDDPHAIGTFGHAYAQASALELLFDRALAALDGDAHPATGFVPREVVLARWYAHQRVGRLITMVIGVLGAGGTSERLGLDRYWRDFRGHTLSHRPHWTLSDLQREG